MKDKNLAILFLFTTMSWLTSLGGWLQISAVFAVPTLLTAFTIAVCLAVLENDE